MSRLYHFHTISMVSRFPHYGYGSIGVTVYCVNKTLLIAASAQILYRTISSNRLPIYVIPRELLGSVYYGYLYHTQCIKLE